MYFLLLYSLVYAILEALTSLDLLEALISVVSIILALLHLSPVFTIPPIFWKYCSLYSISNHGEFLQINPQLSLFSLFGFLTCLMLWTDICGERLRPLTHGFQTKVCYFQLSFEQFNLEELGMACWLLFDFTSIYCHTT